MNKLKQIKLNREQKKLMQQLINDCKVANESWRNTERYKEWQTLIKKEQEEHVNNFLKDLGYKISQNAIIKDGIRIEGNLK